MKELVVFDVDGTLVKGQSQALFLKYLLSIKRVSWFFYLKLMPWFIFYRMGLLKNPRKPMEYAFAFLKGNSNDDIGSLAHDFFEKKLKAVIYPEAVAIIREHQKKGREVLLLSNAAEFIVKEIAQYLGISQYICTTMETSSGYYTGKIRDIMYGGRKVEVIERYVREHHMRNAWAYSDHVSDQYLMSLSEHAVAVNPSSALLAVAHNRQWPVMTFKNPI